MATDGHQERTLVTEMYLEICSSYIDFFLSVSMSLQERIVSAAKVSFFLRIWKLWFKYGDHSVGGNKRTLTLQQCFISNQCFLDIQLSCHFVVLLIRYFRDFHGSFLFLCIYLDLMHVRYFLVKLAACRGWKEPMIFTNLLIALTP
jgi:hypothetical protein